jgi:hypothetical protein
LTAAARGRAASRTQGAALVGAKRKAEDDEMRSVPRNSAGHAGSAAQPSQARTVLALDSPPTSCEDDTEADPAAALLLRVEPVSADWFNRESEHREPHQGAAGAQDKGRGEYVSKPFAPASGLRPGTVFQPTVLQRLAPTSHHLHDNGKGSALAVA